MKDFLQISQMWGFSGVWTVKRARVSRDADADVDLVTSEVASDVISFCASCTTIFPFTSKAKVVSALSADMVVAQVVIKEFWVGVRLSAVNPTANQGGFM